MKNWSNLYTRAMHVNVFYTNCCEGERKSKKHTCNCSSIQRENVGLTHMQFFLFTFATSNLHKFLSVGFLHISIFLPAKMHIQKHKDEGKKNVYQS